MGLSKPPAPSPLHSCPLGLDKKGTEPDVLWHLLALEEAGPVSHLAAQLPGRADSMGRGLAQRGCLFQVMGPPEEPARSSSLLPTCVAGPSLGLRT